MRMRKIMMGLALFATISAGAQELTSGIDRNNMNLKVKPGNDFYEYAAGGWMKSHPLDAEHADNGAFTDLFELSQEQVRGLILGYADGKQPQGSLQQELGGMIPFLGDKDGEGSALPFRLGHAVYQSDG